MCRDHVQSFVCHIPDLWHLINKGNFIQMKCDEKHYFIIIFLIYSNCSESTGDMQMLEIIP